MLLKITHCVVSNSPSLSRFLLVKVSEAIRQTQRNTACTKMNWVCTMTGEHPAALSSPPVAESLLSPVDREPQMEKENIAYHGRRILTCSVYPSNPLEYSLDYSIDV